MAKCLVCNNDVSTDIKDSLIINHVPKLTFGVSNSTITLHMISCAYCGAVQLYNVPLDENYEDVYRSMGISADYREQKKKQIQNFIEKYNLHQSDMIEVGCGDGQILEMLKELGYDVQGVETSESNWEKCRKKDFHVKLGRVSDVTTQYGVMFSFYHLEHIPTPMKFVMDLFRILKPGGIGLIEVPNYDYIEKNSIWLEFTKDHRVYYRKRTLEHLLLACGFTIKSIEEHMGGLCLTAVVCKPKKHVGFLEMKKRIEEDEKKFKDLIDSLEGKYAIYGVGHYAQLLINMIYYKHGIKPTHIFDSNPAKCGSKLHGVEILHKDSIKKYQDIQNIIVICGMYTEEVYNMLTSTNENWKRIVKWN